MAKLPKDPKSPNPKKKIVAGEKIDPVTGYGMSSRTSRKKVSADKKAIRRLKTDDVLNSTGGGGKASQSKRAADTKNITKIGKY